MKLLSVKAKNFKNCIEGYTIDLVAKSRKTAEDKEYELQEIAPDLYVYNTMAFIGKNASGKTSALELLDACYSILGDFRLEDKHYDYDGVELEIVFYHAGFIYKYECLLSTDISLSNQAIFKEEKLYRKKYYKSRIHELYEDSSFEKMDEYGTLPEDISKVFLS